MGFAENDVQDMVSFSFFLPLFTVTLCHTWTHLDIA